MKKKHDIIVKLNELGFSMKDSLAIYNVYKSNTLNVIDKNLYRMIEDVDVITFSKVDEIALKLYEGKNIRLPDYILPLYPACHTGVKNMSLSLASSFYRRINQVDLFCSQGQFHKTHTNSVRRPILSDPWRAIFPSLRRTSACGS